MNRRLLGAFLLLGTLWGSSFVAIDIGLGYFPPIEFAALRYLIAGIVVLGYAWYSTPRWYPRAREEWLVAAIAGSFLIGGHHAFLYLGQQHVSGPIAAVVVSLGPVLTALFAAGLLGDRVTSLDFIGFVLGFLGVFFVAQPGVPEGIGQSVAARLLALDPSALLTGDGVGIATVFLSAVCFALGGVLTQPIETSLPPRTVQAWAMLIGSTLLFVAGLIRGESLAAIRWTPVSGVSLVYLGIVTGAGAFLLYFELLDRIGPTQINLIGYLEPVSATVLSWLLLGELIDPLTAFGFLTIIAGFVCIQRRSFVPFVLSRLHAISFR
ncbi:DMT family transporter [Halocatena pleomorpha]|uniref:EamA/RhaT family transporter n=1 Tax=Halocatena pleomorpha TaxID=1785090 RepID=A0A3P3RAK0_9EURY|nr:EamA family transporter [Halocatena pleomorpha]RRJ30517.1 EamA/RhaT family transporter [Halocatena pleomorpha]